MSDNQDIKILVEDKALWSNKSNLDWNQIIVDSNNYLNDNLKSIIEKFNNGDLDIVRDIVSEVTNKILIIPFSQTLVEETDVSFDNAFEDFTSLLNLLNYLKEQVSLVLYQEGVSKYNNELIELVNDNFFELVILGNEELVSTINTNDKLVVVKNNESFDLVYDLEQVEQYQELITNFVNKFNVVAQIEVDEVEETELVEDNDDEIELTEESIDEIEEETIEELAENEELLEDDELDEEVEEELVESETTPTEFVEVSEIKHISDNNIQNTKVVKGETSKKKIFFVLIYIAILSYVNIPLILILLSGVSQSLFAVLITLLIVLDLFVLSSLNYVRKRVFKKKVIKESNVIENDIFSSIEYVEPVSVNTYDVEEIEETPEDEVQEDDLEESNQVESINFTPKNYLKDSSNYIYGDISNLELYLDNLYTYLNSEELNVNPLLLRTFFANFMASRMIVLNEVNNAKLNLRFMELFNNYIGSNIRYIDLNESLESDVELLENEELELASLIEEANNNKDQVNIAVLYNVDLAGFDSRYQNILNYALNPFVPAKIDAELSKLNLPSNLWFVVVPTNNHFEFSSSSLLLSSFVNRLDIKLVEKASYSEENNYKLSYSNIEELLRNSLEEYYLSEKVWKRLDEFSLINPEKLLFDNRVVTQIENMTAIYKLSNGSEEELVDNILATKILPLVYDFMEEKNIDVIVSLLEKLFNLEDLRQSQIYLNNIKSTNINK